jgi:glutamate--cysteine ligase
MLANPALTPSARVLEDMAEDHANSYTAFALAQSLSHRATIAALPLPEGALKRFDAMAQASIVKQQQMEAADTLPFEDWRRRYLSPEMLRP